MFCNDVYPGMYHLISSLGQRGAQKDAREVAERTSNECKNEVNSKLRVLRKLTLTLDFEAFLHFFRDNHDVVK